MWRVVAGAAIASLCLVSSAAAQSGEVNPPYLNWNAAAAERIGKSTRINGRVGGVLDFRGLHTDHAYNYKLRATWLTEAVIQATARLLQLSERLSDSQTEDLVREAQSAGDAVFLVEIDPREGSGVIPTGWSAFLGTAGNERNVVRGVNTPSLEKLKALRGVFRRDYNYELFWVVFPLHAADGSALFPSGTSHADLTVRISNKEGHVSFPVPAR
jgi:hypothetical protein